MFFTATQEKIQYDKTCVS